MMSSFSGWIYLQTIWLYTKIHENSLFFLDYWSLVHLWTGIVIFLLLSVCKTKYKWIWLGSALFLYELIEIAFLYFALNVFKPESFKDQMTDILVGTLGGGICWQLLIKNSENIYLAVISQKFQMIFSSFTLAFVWVGSYHYQYNISYLNTPGLNLWAFFLWGVGGYYIIALYLFIKRRVEGKINRLIILWLVYFLAILIIEFAGYYLLHIAEISSLNSNPLIFGLIHGSFGMHLYYLVVPFLIVIFHEIFIFISALAQEEPLRINKTSNEEFFRA